MRDEHDWQSRFHFIFITVFSLSALVTSYPKLVLNTFLLETTRKDLIIPFVTASFSSIGIIIFRISFEVAHAFYKFRKKILVAQWVVFVISGLVFLIGIIGLFFLSSDSLSVNLAIRCIIFIIVLLGLYFIFTPKKKLFGKNETKTLFKLSDYVDRQVEISEFASSIRLKKPDDTKKLHKKVMKEIKKRTIVERKKLKPRYEFIKDVKFKPVGNCFEPLPMEEEEKVLRVKIINKESGKVTKSTDVKFKYIKSACKEINRPNNENDMRGFIIPMALKAYSMQIFNESDPNELLFEMSSGGTLKDLKELLNEHNPNINYVAENGWTPLLIAVANGQTEIVRYLLQKAANPNIANKLGISPLLFAVWYGNEPICKMLINYGADINQQDMEGITPLINAAIRGHSSIAKFLIKKGADSQLSDKKQKTALSYAEKGGSGDIARLLRKNSK